MRIRLIVLTILLIGSVSFPAHVNAAPRADVQNDRVTIAFPDTITFSATLRSNVPITSVTLEYGNEQQTCGDVTAKAYPQFAPSDTINVEWTWNMRQSGSLPPGTQLWWRWNYTDETGSQFTSPTQTAVWLDDIHPWQTLTSGNLRLHHYGMSNSTAQSMLEAGAEGLRRNKEWVGLETDGAVDVYLYPNYTDMRDAVLFEPQWTGGLAYSDFNIVLMGLSGGDMTWDRNTIIHELTHVIVGHFAFSCIGSIPTWLNEGLAMFTEGGLSAGMQSQLDRAVRDNNLQSIRSMSGGFSEIPERALLAYAQSYGVVKFMIETYGQEKLVQLLIGLRDAKPVDAALHDVYGFDTDGLEDAWRASVGAAPRPAQPQATAQPTPTHVPTYIPVQGIPQAVTPTPFVIPTSSFGEESPPMRSGPPLSLTIALLCFCLVFLLIVGVIVLGFVVRKDNARAGGKNAQL
jgi:hypothetical protein